MQAPPLYHTSGEVLDVISTPTLAARPAPHAQAPAAGPKQAMAERVMDGAIRVDGTLEEPIWRTAPAVTDFLQAEPDEGAEPTDRMEVRFVYDDRALCVSARMFSTGQVQAPLSRRDDGGQAESIQIELDTFHDRRTAYMFGVTAAGYTPHRPRDGRSTQNRNRTPAKAPRGAPGLTKRGSAAAGASSSSISISASTPNVSYSVASRLSTRRNTTTLSVA